VSDKKHFILNKIEYWKPLTEVFTGVLGLLVSFIALTISVYAVYSSSSSPDMSAHVGRHFGLAILRGNHLPAWDLPEYGYSKEDRFLIVDMAVVVSNAGGKRGVIDHMRLDVTRLNTGESIKLDWKVFFKEPTNRNLEKRPELVTPLVVEGQSSHKRLIRFSAEGSKELLPDFFKQDEKYKFSLGIHRAGLKTKVTEVVEAYSIEWVNNAHRHYNIINKDIQPDIETKSGETALLTLF